MKTAALTYREILSSNLGSDVEFIANVIFTTSTKPTTKLINLLARIRAGQEIRCGNAIDTIRIDGEQFSLSILDTYAHRGGRPL